MMNERNERSELEKRILRAEALGEKHASVYEIWLQLEEDKKNYLAALMNDLDDDKTSESKLERKARASKEFREYVRNLCIAKGEELRAKVRYENSRDWFEAARTRESTEREKMRSLKFIP